MRADIRALTGLSPAPGALVVVITPRGDGSFLVAGRLRPAAPR